MDALKYDLELQQAAERRRRFQDLSNTQAPEGQMVGKVYVNANPLEYLAAGLRRYAGNQGIAQNDIDTQALQQKRNQAVADALRGFQTQMQGTPEKPAFDVPANETDQTGYTMNAVPEQKPNPYAAYSGLMQVPELRDVGMKGIAGLGEASLKDAAERNLAAKKEADRVRYVGILTNAPTPQAAMAQGVPADIAKSYYEARNLGRDKVTWQNAGGSLVPTTEYGDTPAGVKPIGMTGNQFKDLVVAGPNGTVIQNKPLVEARKAIQKEGATNVSVNTATKPFLNELGKGVGEKVINDFNGAQSASASLNNVAQIENGLNKLITGPGAGVRIKLSQIGETLGINGKDATEQLQNTRNVIQGLARQELAAAGQMKGQGQITESERGILRRAESGDITELTAPEITTLLGAIKKTSNYRIGVHQANVNRLKNDPNAASIVDYMNVPTSDANNAPTQSSAKPGMPDMSAIDAEIARRRGK